MKKNCLLVLALITLFACAHSPKNDAPPAPPASPSTSLDSAEAKALKKDAAKGSLASAGAIICKNGTDERSLKVVPKGEGCELVYTKFGASKVISWSGYNVKRCDTSRDKVWKELEAAGFTCE